MTWRRRSKEASVFLFVREKGRENGRGLEQIRDEKKEKVDDGRTGGERSMNL